MKIRFGAFLVCIALVLVFCCGAAFAEDSGGGSRNRFSFTDPNQPERDADLQGRITAVDDASVTLSAMGGMGARFGNGEIPEDRPEGASPEDRPEGFSPENMPEGFSEEDMPEPQAYAFADSVAIKQVAEVNEEIMVLDIFRSSLAEGQMAIVWLNDAGQIEYMQIINIEAAGRQQRTGGAA